MPARGCVIAAAMMPLMPATRPMPVSSNQTTSADQQTDQRKKHMDA